MIRTFRDIKISIIICCQTIWIVQDGTLCEYPIPGKTCSSGPRNRVNYSIEINLANPLIRKCLRNIEITALIDRNSLGGIKLCICRRSTVSGKTVCSISRYGGNNTVGVYLMDTIACFVYN